MKLPFRYLRIFSLTIIVGISQLNAFQLPEGTEETNARLCTRTKSITASGEQFNDNWLSCSHPTLPFGTVLRIQNQRTGRSIDVKVNDRDASFKGITLSKIAANTLGINTQTGIIPVNATPIGITSAQLLPAKDTVQKDPIMVSFDPSAFDEKNREEQMILQSSAIMVSLAGNNASREVQGLSQSSTTTPTSFSRATSSQTHGSNHQKVTFRSLNTKPNNSMPRGSDSPAADKPMLPVPTEAPLRAQFGVFNNPISAIELMNELNAQGFETTIFSTQQQHHVVTKGTFSSQDRASLWINKAQRLHHRQLAPVRL